MTTDRRISHRVPVDMFMTEYVADRPARVFAANISETGIHVARARAPFERRTRVVQVEFRLPGTTDTIWASAEVCHDALDSYFHTSGLELRAIAGPHRRWLRDYVMGVRVSRLGAMLDRIQRRMRMH